MKKTLARYKKAKLVLDAYQLLRRAHAQESNFRVDDLVYTDMYDGLYLINFIQDNMVLLENTDDDAIENLMFVVVPIDSLTPADDVDAKAFRFVGTLENGTNVYEVGGIYVDEDGNEVDENDVEWA